MKFKTLVAAFGLSCAITFIGQLVGANGAGRSTVVLFLLLAVGFGWTLIGTRKRRQV